MPAMPHMSASPRFRLDAHDVVGEAGEGPEHAAGNEAEDLPAAQGVECGQQDPDGIASYTGPRDLDPASPEDGPHLLGGEETNVSRVVVEVERAAHGGKAQATPPGELDADD